MSIGSAEGTLHVRNSRKVFFPPTGAVQPVKTLTKRIEEAMRRSCRVQRKKSTPPWASSTTHFRWQEKTVNHLIQTRVVGDELPQEGTMEVLVEGSSHHPKVDWEHRLLAVPRKSECHPWTAVWSSTPKRRSTRPPTVKLALPSSKRSHRSSISGPPNTNQCHHRKEWRVLRKRRLLWRKSLESEWFQHLGPQWYNSRCPPRMPHRNRWDRHSFSNCEACNRRLTRQERGNSSIRRQRT